MDQLKSLLTSLLNPGEQIKELEKTYQDEFVAKNPEMLLSYLATILCDESSGSDPIRALAGVLFRRSAFTSSNLWNSSSVDLKNHVKQTLLKSFMMATYKKNIYNKLCDLMAEVIRAELTYSDSAHAWPEFCSILNNPRVENFYGIFKILSGVPELLSKQNPESTCAFFQNGFMQENTAANLSEILVCLANFLDFMDEESDYDLQCFSNLMQLALIKSLNSAVKDTAFTEDILTTVIDIISGHGHLLKKEVILELIQLALAFEEHGEDESIKMSALELITSIVEACPKFFKGKSSKGKEVLPLIVNLLFKIMIDREDDPEWFLKDGRESVENEEEDEEGELVVAGCTSLDRICIAVGGKTMLPLLFNHTPSLISSGKWNQQLGGLASITYSSEGCRELLKEQLKPVLTSLVLPLFNPKTDARVLYAACSTLGQLASDISSSFCKSSEVFEMCLSAVLSIVAVPDIHVRVQCHATAAIINLIDAAVSSKSRSLQLSNYTSAILQKLGTLLGHCSSVAVKEQALSTISVVAEHLGDESYRKFYPALIPLFLEGLKNGSGAYRAKSIEAVSFSAVAVGKEVFSANRQQEILETLMSIQNSNLSADDPAQEELSFAWNRISKVLKKDFLPFLQHYFPFLLSKANVAPKMTVVTENQDIEDEEYEGWEFYDVPGKKVGVHTSLLNEKADALHAIKSLAFSLGGDFAPYAEQVFPVAVSLLSFEYHDGVQEAACDLIPAVFRCFVKSGMNPEKIATMYKVAFHAIINEMNKKISPESFWDADELMCLFYSLHETWDALGSVALSDDVIASWMTAFQAIFAKNIPALVESLKTQYKQQWSDEYEEDDEEDDEADEENIAEENLLYEMIMSVEVIMKIKGAAAVPIFDHLVPLFQQLLTSDVTTLRHHGISAFGDAIKYFKSEAAKYMSICFPVFQAIISPPPSAKKKSKADSQSPLTLITPVLKQAAVYGVGLCALYVKEYSAQVQSCLPSLFALANRSDARSDENVLVTENVCSTICKILQSQSQAISPESLSSWIFTLPVVNDFEEVSPVYSFLIDSLTRYPNIFMETNEKLAMTIKALIDVTITFSATSPVASIEEEEVEQEVLLSKEPKLKEQIKATLSKLLSHAPPQIVTQLAQQSYSVSDRELLKSVGITNFN